MSQGCKIVAWTFDFVINIPVSHLKVHSQVVSLENMVLASPGSIGFVYKLKEFLWGNWSLLVKVLARLHTSKQLWVDEYNVLLGGNETHIPGMKTVRFCLSMGEGHIFVKTWESSKPKLRD